METVDLDSLWIQVVEATGDAVLLALPDGQVLHANFAFLTLFGYQSHEVIGCKLAALSVFSDHHSLQKMVGHVVAGETHSPIDVLVPNRDGHHLQMSMRLAPLLGKAGRVSAVAVFLHNRGLLHELDLNTRLLSSIVESSQDAIIAKKLDGTITSWNTAAVEMFGYSADEALGRSITMLFPVERLAEEADIMARVRRGERVRHYEARRLSKDGSLLDLSITVSPIRNAAGSVIGASKIARNMREERARSDRLAVLASVFENCGEAIMILNAHGQFAEVNNSFTAITGFSRDEILGKSYNAFRSGRQSPDEARRMVRELRRNHQSKGDIWTRRKDGGALAGFLTVTSLPGASSDNRYIAILADVTSIRIQQEKLERLSHFDTLTGLPNRLLLHERLDHALAQSAATGHDVTVAYLDIDGFKFINDRYGHDAGDEILRALANRMAACLRPTDSVGRIGGDEFVVILPQIRTANDHQGILDELLHRICQPIRSGGVEIQVSASIGVTTHPQDHGGSEQLLRSADQAMYEVKRQGGNQIRHFDSARQAQELHLRNLATEIETALSEGQIELHFQPKVDLLLGTVIGVEGLIRWLHPTAGTRQPGSFLPSLIEHPVIEKIGAFVVRQGFEAITHLANAGLNIPVSINVTARELRRTNFAAYLGQEAIRAKVQDRSLMQLELPETTALADEPQIESTLAQCSAMGFGLAIDDFGIGFASLSYLGKIPADVIKLDQSFVKNINRDESCLKIAIAVVAMAGAFGKSVVAEGVESDAAARTLLAVGCRFAQGFAISPALPMDQLIWWLKAWQARLISLPEPLLESGLLIDVRKT